MVIFSQIGERLHRLLLNNPYSVLLLIFFCIPALYGFYYIDQYAVNVPVWDPWSYLVPWTTSYYDGSFDYGGFFEPQNDSRPVISNVAMFLISLLTQLNMISLFFIGYFIYIVFGALLILSFSRHAGLNKGTLILSIPLIFYLFNPFLLNRFLDNIGSLFYPIMLLTALLTIFFLDGSRHSNYSFLCSLGMGIACTFSFAAGSAVWFAGFVQLFLQKMERKWVKVSAWTGTAILTLFTNYIVLGFPGEGLHSNTAISGFLSLTFQYPIQKFLCFLGTLGAEVVHDQYYALFFGILIFITGIILLVNNRGALDLDRFAKWYGLLAFGLLTSIFLTLARSGVTALGDPEDTIFFIPEARHSLVFFLPLACLYILAILYVKKPHLGESPSDKKYCLSGKNLPNKRACINLFSLGILFLLMVSGVVFHINPGLDTAENSYVRNNINQYILHNYDTADETELNRLYYDTDIVRFQAAKLEQYHLSVFSGSNSMHRPGLATLQTIELPPATGDINYQIDYIETGKGSEGGGIVVIGWAFVHNTNARPSDIKYLVVCSETHAYIYDTVIQRRTGVTQYFNSTHLNLDASGFQSNVPIGQLDDGLYQIGIIIVQEGYSSFVMTPTMIEKKDGAVSKYSYNWSPDDLYTYLNAAHKPARATLKDIQIPAATKDIMYEFDQIQTGNLSEEPEMFISGWAFVKNEDTKPGISKYLVLHSDTGSLIYDTLTQRRRDVTSAFNGTNLNLDASGFQSFIPVGQLADNTYQIGIIIHQDNASSFAMTPIVIEKKDGTIYRHTENGSPENLSQGPDSVASIEKATFQDIPLPDESRRIRFEFDQVQTGEIPENGEMLISGWAFIEDTGIGNTDRKYLVLRSDTNVSVFDTRTQQRRDVTLYFASTNLNLDASGFQSSVPIGQLEDGIYQAGILIARDDEGSFFSMTPLLLEKGNGTIRSVSGTLTEVEINAHQDTPGIPTTRSAFRNLFEKFLLSAQENEVFHTAEKTFFFGIDRVFQAIPPLGREAPF